MKNIDLFNFNPRKSHEVKVGNTLMGGGHPLRLQSMTTTLTTDTEASVEQCIRIIEAGADLVRLTTQGTREAENLRNIRAELDRLRPDENDPQEQHSHLWQQLLMISRTIEPCYCALHPQQA